MGPHCFIRPALLRLLLVTALGALLLPACTKGTVPDKMSATTSSLSGEWVDAKLLFKHPENFVNRGRFRVYLDGVDDFSSPSEIVPGHWNIFFSDTRLDRNEPIARVMMTPSTHKTWEQARLERLNKYGITISGHLQSFGDANYKWYAFVADGVEINEEDSMGKMLQRQLPDNYRPTQILTLPRPETITDSKRFSVLAKDYAGRLVRLETHISARNLQVSPTGMASITTPDVSFELNETLVRELLDKIKEYADVQMIGKVLKERDQDGRVRVEVTSVEVQPGF